MRKTCCAIIATLMALGLPTQSAHAQQSPPEFAGSWTFKAWIGQGSPVESRKTKDVTKPERKRMIGGAEPGDKLTIMDVDVGLGGVPG